MEEKDIIQEAKENSASLIEALTPIMDQIAMCHLRRENLNRLDLRGIRGKELDTIESYYLDMICDVLNIKR